MQISDRRIPMDGVRKRSAPTAHVGLNLASVHLTKPIGYGADTCATLVSDLFLARLRRPAFRSKLGNAV